MKRFILHLSLVILLISCKNSAAPYDSSELISGEISYDSTKIHYVSSGAGDTTLLFIHGWGINNTYWKSQLNFFGPNYRVYAMDLPGFGQSASNRTEWTVEHYSEDIIQFINQLELKKVILIGHSMSGDIILETALQKNSAIIGLVGVDNFKMLDVSYSEDQMKEMSAFVDLMKSDLKKYAPVYAWNYLFNQTTDTIVRRKVMDDYAAMDSTVGISTLIDIMRYGQLEAEKLRELDLKLNLINTDAFPTNTDGLKKYCKSSFELFEVHSTGHFPMIEKPEEFNRLLEKAILQVN